MANPTKPEYWVVHTIEPTQTYTFATTSNTFTTVDRYINGVWADSPKDVKKEPEFNEWGEIAP